MTLATWLARGSPGMSLRTRYRTRFAFAVGFSLLVHVLLLALRFGAPGAGLPGLDLPWAERRVQASGLTVRLLEIPRPAPSPEAPPAASDGGIRLKLSTELSNLPKPVLAQRAFDGALVSPPAAAVAPPAAENRDPGEPPPTPSPRESAANRETASTPPPELIVPPPRLLPPVLAQREPQDETFNVPPPQATPVEELPPIQTAEDTQRKQAAEALRNQAEEALRKQAEETARLQAAEAAARQREEEAAQRALTLEKEREARMLAEEKSRREAEELARQRALALKKAEEEAKRLALEAEARKRAEEELARVQTIAREKELAAKRQAEEAAARAKAVAERERAEREAAAARAKEIAERERAQKEAAARRERERLALEAPPAAPGPSRPLSGRELAAKAIEQMRTPTPPRLEAPRAQPPGPTADNRRRSIFGVERDVSLKMYVDSWRWKIERNGTYNYRPSAAFNSRENPIVTVSIRSDGSLEDVLIHRSSGVREIDDAVVRIAQLHAPYSKFPPDLARQYDVIEIRRVWLFDARLKILDEM